MAVMRSTILRGRAFDPSFRIFSPSHILYDEFLKWSFGRRLEVDFRIGNDHWHLLKSGATSYEIPFSGGSRLSCCGGRVCDGANSPKSYYTDHCARSALP